MSFEVSADAYRRFMGRYSEPLAGRFADVAGIGPGQPSATASSTCSPHPPITITAQAWTTTAHVPS